MTVPLLIKFTDFTATNVNNQYVALKWATDTEVSSKYFEVQRSINGTDFTAVVQVNAAGNSTTVQNYSANDNQPANGVNFYRLKEVSTTGNIQYSDTIQVEITLPLTVRLVEFTATDIDNQYVLLKWTTNTEVNGKYFEVQRSANSIDFNAVAQVDAIGNSTTPQNYSANDYQPANGLNFYRLKEVAQNGDFLYSDTIKITWGVKNIPQVYPNPAGPYFTVTSGMETIKDVSIFDAAGKLVMRILNNNGLSSIRINSAVMAAGIYVVKITTASQVYEQKLFKR